MGDLCEELRDAAKLCDVYSPDQCATLIDGIGWIAMRHLLNKAADALAASERDGVRLDWIAMRGRNVRPEGKGTAVIRWASCIPNESVCDPRINIRIAIDAAIEREQEKVE